jgi:hypothetical protein
VIDRDLWHVGSRIELCPRRALDLTFPPPEPHSDGPERVTLDVAEAYNGRFPGVRERALKSNETPLDVLRRVPGFIEIDRVIEIGSCPATTEP